MPSYYIYKVYIAEKYFVTVSKDQYPQRVMNSLRRSSEYILNFGKEIAIIAFLKKIEEHSLAQARYVKDLYAITQLDLIKAVNVSTTNSADGKVAKYEPTKMVARNDDLKIKIRMGIITKDDVGDLIDYNEAVKRQDRPSFDRRLLTDEDKERCRLKYKNFNPKSVRCENDLFYCDECSIFVIPTSKLRHLNSPGHIKIMNETLVVD
tara:strand:- start:22 stop:642 length:621 start_codon:yes stop_codon:yes gene_type:complete